MAFVAPVLGLKPKFFKPIQSIMNLALELGIIINLEKSSLAPMQVIDYLGMTIDTHRFWVTLRLCSRNIRCISVLRRAAGEIMAKTLFAREVHPGVTPQNEATPIPPQQNLEQSVPTCSDPSTSGLGEISCLLVKSSENLQRSVLPKKQPRP